MLSAYRPQLPPLFGKLPQELYREIYDCDSTYHNVFNDPMFVYELQLNSYKMHYYKLLYKFIEEEVQPRNIMDGVRTEYNISLTPHPENPNVMCFILESTNTTRNPDNIPESKLHWSGYVCEEEYDETFMVYYDDMDYRRYHDISESLNVNFENGISDEHLSIVYNMNNHYDNDEDDYYDY